MKRLLFLTIILCPVVLGAQGLRISGVTTMQFIELRPLVTDSILGSLLPGTGDSPHIPHAYEQWGLGFAERGGQRLHREDRVLLRHKRSARPKHSL
jgi:hypothetical protein